MGQVSVVWFRGKDLGVGMVTDGEGEVHRGESLELGLDLVDVVGPVESGSVLVELEFSVGGCGSAVTVGEVVDDQRHGELLAGSDAGGGVLAVLFDLGDLRASVHPVEGRHFGDGAGLGHESSLAGGDQRWDGDALDLGRVVVVNIKALACERVGAIGRCRSSAGRRNAGGARTAGGGGESGGSGSGDCGAATGCAAWKTLRVPLRDV